jgi:hypothetical protein
VRPKTFAGFHFFRAGTKLLDILTTSDVQLSTAALRKRFWCRRDDKKRSGDES